jgi:MYXO-CTERM domain-containing protein
VRSFFLALTCVVMLSAASSASAQTTILGGNVINQTWTAAGSPYRIQGDVTVPVGAYLHVDPGVVIEAATGDGQVSGLDTGEVEITVQGELTMLGTAGSPIVVRGVGSGRGAWYGLVIGASASNVIITQTSITNAQYGIRSDAAGTVLALSDTTISTCSNNGLQLNAGLPTVSRLTVFDCSIGVYVGTSGAVTLESSILRSNSSYGLYVYQSTTSPADTVLNQSTVYGNGSAGVWRDVLASPTRVTRVTNSIVSSNASQGFYNAGAMAGFVVSNTDVWGQSTPFTGSFTTTANLVANPLYVSAPTNLRITSNSPCRFASSTAGDVGALPYGSDPTPGLYGTLWTNTTLTTAGSPYTVGGDLTVASAVTLTVEPGVTLRFATGDVMGSGVDTGEVELVVRGRLVAAGTPSNGIVFDSSGTGRGAWYGIRIASSAGSTLDYATVTEAQYGLIQEIAAAHTVQRSTFSSVSNNGIQVNAGTLTADAITVFDCSIGVYVSTSGAAVITNSILRSNSSYGLYVYQSTTSPADTVLDQSTVYGNGSAGVWRDVLGSPGRVTRVRNSIVSSNASQGFYNAGSMAGFSISNTDVWGQSTPFTGSFTTADNLAANPLYVSAPTNLRITSNSPCRFASSTAGDIGALPYGSDPTPGLHGTLFSNTTLTVAGSPYTVAGDLTVALGVTLTVEPGVTVRFATGDLMGAGADTGEVELRVSGRLLATGTAMSPIVFDSSGTGRGAWYGIRLSSGTASSLDYVTVTETQYGLIQEVIATHTVMRSTFSTCSNNGIQVNAGTLTADAILVFDCSIGVYVSTSGAAVLTNSILRNNSSYGLYAYQSTTSPADTSLHSSTVYGNGSAGMWRDVLGSPTRAVRVRNAIVANNASQGFYNAGSMAGFEVASTDVFGQSTPYTGSFTTSGNLSANPLFVAPPTDLRLQSGSVCIDAGAITGAPNHDYSGVSRPLNGDGINGSEFDLGAYEFPLMVMCGNGILEAGESCDSGANNGLYGFCRSDCTGLGQRCGDTLVNGPEACDDGNASNTDACLSTCVAASCGDTFVRMGVETCDDGNMTTTDGCIACMSARCGDGYLQSGVEQCDDANASSTDACVAGCRAAVCGDGFIRAGVETCDDGNTMDGDACPSTCVAGVCGDGRLDAGEACDDGNAITTDACVSCRFATCGDGFVRAGAEQCDDGNLSQTDACLNTCLSARCGDGNVQAGVEACDDGNARTDDGCLNTCEAASCGDGYVRAGVEVCDDGNTSDLDGCVGTCMLASCGDGFVRTGVEMCDDGNPAETDACIACFDARCGDGHVQAGVEGCDDGNRVDTDACPNSCVLPSCGDGIMQPGEPCDDGNASNEDGCLVGCALPACGDGYVRTGVEDCDDGNTMQTDACLNSCDAAICGDGFLWDGMETCDDGDTTPGDGCDAACMTETTGDGGMGDAGELDGGVMLDAGTSDAATGDAGGADGGGLDGGGLDAGGPPATGGCACRAESHGRAPATLGLGLLLALGLLVRRRR